MASVAKADPLPYVRSFQVDNYAVLKVHFWPNTGHGIHAAIITAHGCWVVDLSSNPGQEPSRFSNLSLVMAKTCALAGSRAFACLY